MTGLNEDQSEKIQNLSVYNEFLESSFLDDTENFYEIESAQFLLHNPATEYVKQVGKIFDKEKKRVQIYLHESTMERLVKILQDVLISNHIQVLWALFDYFVPWL